MAAIDDLETEVAKLARFSCLQQEALDYHAGFEAGYSGKKPTSFVSDAFDKGYDEGNAARFGIRGKQQKGF